MEDSFYIRLRGRTQGPFSPEQLRSMVARGKFGRLYEISSDGTHWDRASGRPDLFPQPPALAAQTQEEDLSLIESDEPSEQTGGEPNNDPPLWYYTKESVECGPVDFAQLSHLVRIGQVAPREHAWSEGMPDWLRISEVPGLAPAVANAGASTAPGTVVNVSSSGPNASASIAEAMSLAPRTSAMAIASLVLSLLGWNMLPLVGSILAIVFGHMALREIRDSAGRITGEAMAMAGLILGYLVVIGTLVAFIGFLLLLLIAAAAATPA